MGALTRIEARRLRPDRDLEEVRREVRGAVDDYERDARLGLSVPLGEPDAMAERVISAVTDFGPLTELLARTDVEEVFVEGGRVSYLDTAGRLRGLTVPTSEEENRRIVDRLLASTDRHLSTKHPLVQARVLQGSARLTAAIAPGRRPALGNPAPVHGLRCHPRRAGLPRILEPTGGRLSRRADATPQPSSSRASRARARPRSSEPCSPPRPRIIASARVKRSQAGSPRFRARQLPTR